MRANPATKFLSIIIFSFFIILNSSCGPAQRSKKDIEGGIEMEEPRSTDRGKEITQEEWDEAIECVIQKYPEETFIEIWEAIKNEGDSWSGKRHHGFGMDVRNTLRSSGLGWGSIALDSYWDDVIEDATRKVISEKEGK